MKTYMVIVAEGKQIQVQAEREGEVDDRLVFQSGSEIVAVFKTWLGYYVTA